MWPAMLYVNTSMKGVNDAKCTLFSFVMVKGAWRLKTFPVN